MADLPADGLGMVVRVRVRRLVCSTMERRHTSESSARSARALPAADRPAHEPCRLGGAVGGSGGIATVIGSGHPRVRLPQHASGRRPVPPDVPLRTWRARPLTLVVDSCLLIANLLEVSMGVWDEGEVPGFGFAERWFADAVRH